MGCVADEQEYDLPLTGPERHLLWAGLAEWGGPARCTDDLAVGMGFESVEDLFAQADRITPRLRERQPLTRRDWIRTLLATEIVFASNTVGSGHDWSITTGISDEETVRLLRSVQEKVPARRPEEWWRENWPEHE
jgi:hypothetical protein